jgi:hypothetical protein
VEVIPVLYVGLAITPALDAFLNKRTLAQSRAYNYKQTPARKDNRRAKKQLRSKRVNYVRGEHGAYARGAHEGDDEGADNSEAPAAKKRKKKPTKCTLCRTIGCRGGAKRCPGGGPSLYVAELEAEREKQNPCLTAEDFIAACYVTLDPTQGEPNGSGTEAQQQAQQQAQAQVYELQQQLTEERSTRLEELQQQQSEQEELSGQAGTAASDQLQQLETELATLKETLKATAEHQAEHQAEDQAEHQQQWQQWIAEQQDQLEEGQQQLAEGQQQLAEQQQEAEELQSVQRHLEQQQQQSDELEQKKFEQQQQQLELEQQKQQLEQQQQQLEQQKLEQEQHQAQLSLQSAPLEDGTDSNGQESNGQNPAEERAKYWRQIASLRVELHKEQKRAEAAENSVGTLQTSVDAALAAEVAAGAKAAETTGDAAALRKQVHLLEQAQVAQSTLQQRTDAVVEEAEGVEGEDGLRKQLRRARAQLRLALRREQQRQEEDVRRATEAAVASAERITRAVEGPQAVVTDILKDSAADGGSNAADGGSNAADGGSNAADGGSNATDDAEAACEGSAGYRSMVEELRRLRKRERQLENKAIATEASVEELRAGVDEGHKKLQRWRRRQAEAETKRQRGDAVRTMGVSSASLALGVLLCLLYFVVFGGGGPSGRRFIGV